MPETRGAGLDRTSVGIPGRVRRGLPTQTGTFRDGARHAPALRRSADGRKQVGIAKRIGGIGPRVVNAATQ
jgi:hypothetical protein